MLSSLLIPASVFQMLAEDLTDSVLIDVREIETTEVSRKLIWLIYGKLPTNGNGRVWKPIDSKGFEAVRLLNANSKPGANVNVLS